MVKAIILVSLVALASSLDQHKLRQTKGEIDLDAPIDI
jgi:hypothetical protein